MQSATTNLAYSSTSPKTSPCTPAQTSTEPSPPCPWTAPKEPVTKSTSSLHPTEPVTRGTTSTTRWAYRTAPLDPPITATVPTAAPPSLVSAILFVKQTSAGLRLKTKVSCYLTITISTPDSAATSRPSAWTKMHRSPSWNSSR